MKIVAVIPAYNEEQRIRNSAEDAGRFVDTVVVVDDCSKDKTGEVALTAGAHVLRHEINRGQGAALQTGTDYAVQNLEADIIVHFDADGQMQGADIPKMIEPILNSEVDIVLGSRFLGAESNMPLSRRLTLWLALLFTRLVSGIKISDTHNGFRALSKYSAQNIKISLDRMAHASEILDLIKLKNLKFVERPVMIKYTADTLAKGQSFMSGFIVLKDFIKSKFID
ncbi:glycosyltransferase family 2 protein [Candidatus Uhrbacteria bacterium CG_4_10_14_0_2_um_filter_41_7]|uniref:Glycosyltransferase family 2 protein n=1 Tax=Candidatus Uhrbacteria bacterium CG_4_9_14_3_um_filter_41_35 TaxID=1975034 RepID=A0A2M7XCY9_9BACT|nr:MAG: glycosyltransferase family 2 protein [Candidatus Uhrbacteria bacterium CG_4_10_14_0_2_um_filter_41_7]PJA45733.1 MAG: glycosyltransferase family 2 protein [Candidatus Uhrbacteria bacterium CG_4_9_14_3_um_filter_41_35]